MQRIAVRLFQLFREIGDQNWIDEETRSIDRYAQRYLQKHGMTSALSDYRGYPSSSSVCVNDVAVHGIPGVQKIGRGDIFSVDIAAYGEGYVSDTAWTYITPGSPHRSVVLVENAWTLIRTLVQEIRPGIKVREIGILGQKTADDLGIHVIPDFVGHGIGRGLHENPAIPFHAGVDRGAPVDAPVELPEGAVVNIEPVVTDRPFEIQRDEDGWTYRLADGHRTAHFEMSVLITSSGPRVLQFDGIEARNLPQKPPFGLLKG